MAYATVDDLEKSWRPLTDQERSRAEMLIDGICAAIDSMKPASYTPPEALARMVVCNVARRSMAADATADGAPVTSYTKSATPYSETWQYGSSDGRVSFTAQERKMLRLGGARAFCATPYLEGGR